jgi:hypothetical protein
MSSSLDEAIAAMARGDQDVALRGASIDDDDAVRLAAALKLNTTITRVDLYSECQARARCARSFEVCGGRCRSCVSDNDIGDAGAASIAEALKLNTTITSVNLGSECRAGAGALCARSFEVCGGRCRSCVSGNRIGDAGAASIAEALKLNTTIMSVDLEGECRAGAGVLCAVV